MVFLESLESRLFLSATPAQVSAALKVIKTQGSVVTANLKVLDKMGKSDFAVVAADVKRLKATKTQASLVKAANSAGKSLVSTLSKDLASGASSINKLVSRLVADEKKLTKTPASATLQARVSADNSSLNSALGAFRSKLSADGDSGAVTTALNAIATANSSDAKTGTDVTTAEININDNLDTFTTSVTTYASDVAALQTLYASPT